MFNWMKKSKPEEVVKREPEYFGKLFLNKDGAMTFQGFANKSAFQSIDNWKLKEQKESGKAVENLMTFVDEDNDNEFVASITFDGAGVLVPVGSYTPMFALFVEALNDEYRRI